MKKVFFFSLLIAFFMPAFCQYHISNAGKQFIKKTETLQLKAYYDANGYSIGYGHHSKDVKKGQKITENKANQYFVADIAEAEKMANYLIKALPYKYSFKQGFFDGLVSIVYNAGVGGVQKSAFYNRLKHCRVKNGKMNAADFDYTMAAVKQCCVSCEGHKNRRNEEYKMMCKK